MGLTLDIGGETVVLLDGLILVAGLAAGLIFILFIIVIVLSVYLKKLWTQVQNQDPLGSFRIKRPQLSSSITPPTARKEPTTSSSWPPNPVTQDAPRSYLGNIENMRNDTRYDNTRANRNLPLPVSSQLSHSSGFPSGGSGGYPQRNRGDFTPPNTPNQPQNMNYFNRDNRYF